MNSEQQKPEKQCAKDDVGKGRLEPARASTGAARGNRDFDYGFDLNTNVIGGYR